MKTDIYYFSGTGNSLFVAKELKKRLVETEIIPIVRLLKSDHIKTNGESVGIVFPIHALTIPIAVRKFLRKIDFNSAKYIFVVSTRLGIIFNDFQTISSLIKKKKHHLDSFFLINMHSNDAKDKNYKTPTAKDIADVEKTVMTKIEIISDIVKGGKTYIENDNTFLINHPYGRIRNRILEKTVINLLKISERIGGVNYFYCDKNCTGCGTCEKVCLSGKIIMANRKPMWKKNVVCFMCYACLNYCPISSVQIKDIPGVKSYTNYVGRYSHPYATSKDIFDQK
jgi:ferredoxin